MNTRTSFPCFQIWKQAQTYLIEERRSVIIATVVDAVGSNPQQVGARILVVEDHFIGTVGGGRIESHILRDAKTMLKENSASCLTKYNLQDIGMTCGGVMTVFFERFEPAPHAVIFGGGHVASPTAALANQVGFDVTVIDERTEWANFDRFPTSKIVNQPFSRFLETFQAQSNDYIILVSKGHATDQVILETLINGPQKFLGMIGSKRKAWSMWKKLQKKGISEEAWKKVHCPIGLPIEGSHPQEIAVSIVAQLIKARYQTLDGESSTLENDLQTG